MIGNFIGTFVSAFALYFTPLGTTLASSALTIMNARLANGFIWNFVLSVFCGILVIVAVKGFKWSNGNLFFVMLPVMVFILCGFGHCIADSFYFWMLPFNWNIIYEVLIPEIFGNFIGCCLMGMVNK